MTNILEHRALIYIYDLFESHSKHYRLEINWHIISQEMSAYAFKSYYHIKSIEKMYGRYGTYIPLHHPEMANFVESINELNYKYKNNLCYTQTSSDSENVPKNIEEEYDLDSFLYFLGSLINKDTADIKDALRASNQKNKLTHILPSIDNKNPSSLIKI